MSAITSLLSQHQMLSMLCAHLASADIIHLAATSKEHYDYLLGSNARRQKFLANAICDGRGLETQGRLSGAWPGISCLGPDSRPCSDCGAQVCDTCRFHIVWPWEWGRPGIDVQGFAFADEEDFIAQTEPEARYSHGKSISDIVQYRKAFEIFWQKRNFRLCRACKPLLLPSVNAKDRCRCTLFDHFVGKRWLCMTCFLKEETAANGRRRERVVDWDPETRAFDVEETCSCGELASKKSSVICFICTKARVRPTAS